jgi:hypothetical protein
MRLHEQRDALVKAIDTAIRSVGSGPPLGAFGPDDCAATHIDYFTGVEMALAHLAGTVKDVTGLEDTSFSMADGCCGECYQLGQPCCMEPRPEPLYRIVYAAAIGEFPGKALRWPQTLAKLREHRDSPPASPVVRVIRDLWS